MSGKISPYGSWTSPITTERLVAETVGLSQPVLGEQVIHWAETRPREGGRTVIVRRLAHGQPTDLFQAPWSARTRVNEYGGGSFVVGESVVYFSNESDQRLYAVREGNEPVPITPEGRMRYADAVIDARRERLICVREDHNVVDTQAETTLCAVPLRGGSEGEVLVSGADFYATPRLSPDGTRLSWLTWNHPNMPWDGTELWVARIEGDGSLGARERIAGGPRESIFQPEWAPDGTLCFASDRTGFWNLYRWRAGTIETLTEREEEFGRPQWIFGNATYGFDGDGKIACLHCDRGIWRLSRLDPETRRLTPVEVPFTELRFLRAGGTSALLLGGSPAAPEALVRIDLGTGAVETVRSSTEARIEDRYLSRAERIEVPTARGLTAHALYYAPVNSDAAPPAGEKPPLLVRCHGGPTSAASSTLDHETQFWTSRGFAFVDVNHGGSTGYGRAYRERLNGQWGVVDVEDCEAAARYLIERGLADPRRVAIRGGSAGGYTTLRALEHSRVFRAGASYFGIGDVEIFVNHYEHKFEWKYEEHLIGPYPERRDLYRERSPVHEADRIEVPVIFFQGTKDIVCPPEQTEVMVQALRAKGSPFAYLSFEGEGHGFRRGDSIRRALEAELYFYGRVFGFEPADRLEPIPIENFDARC